MSALLSDVLFYIHYFIYHVLIIGHWLYICMKCNHLFASVRKLG